MFEQVVYIVDDDEAVRNSIKELVESVGLKARDYANALDYLEQHDSNRAGCIVLDVRMAGLSGLALQKELNKRGSVTPIIFVTAYADIAVAVGALKNGAFDFLTKPYHEQCLLDVINSALKKNAENRVTRSERDIFKRKVDALTAREQEVLGLIADGLANKAVAERLEISVRTVEVHRRRALTKIGTRSVLKIKEHLSD